MKRGDLVELTYPPVLAGAGDRETWIGVVLESRQLHVQDLPMINVLWSRSGRTSWWVATNLRLV